MRRLSPAEPLLMLATVALWLVLAMLTGALVGTVCSLFLRLLLASEGRLYDASWALLAALLPLAGLANGLLLHYGYRLNVSGLKDEPIVAVNEQQGRMPLATLWIKPLAALITLGCGGSAGKEGPCSHIGAGVAAGLGQALRLNAELRKRLVACGVSAGFASVFGTPIAGAIYGVEMLAIGRIRHDFLFPGVVAGVTAFVVSRLWGTPYPEYHIAFEPQFTQWLFLKTVLIGVLCGVAASWFVEAVQLTRLGFAWLGRRFTLWPPLLPLAGGVLLALLLIVLPRDFMGLSLPVMERALQGEPVPWLGFLVKIALVSLTLGSGFYGGIVTPQFVIGTVLGGAVAPLLGMHPAQGAAVGMVAVVASASNTPVAAVLMGVELFGGNSTLYVAGACVSAYLMIGHRSVYPAQHLAYPKAAWFSAPGDQPVGHEKVQLSYGLLRWWSEVVLPLWRRLREAARRG
ncbi:MAG: chloride channel protein [Proteobacteria bacterium]|nr:chloride channel protein [Pseudomonadota bacterium]